MKRKIILDVDTGGDDAVAILLAGHHPDLGLVAVTVCHGNAPLDITLDNTLRVVEAGGLTGVPVYRGAASPLVADMIDSHPIQKATLPLPPATISQQTQHAVSFLIDYYLGPSGPETIFAPVAPHSNLALALRLEPEIRKRVPRIVTMAGAYGEGNVTPSAEFNIMADPEAAHIVFNAGIPITMIGLEVTSQALVTLEDADRLASSNTPRALIAVEIIRNEARWFKDNLGLDGAQIYDACTVAVVIEPDIVKTMPMHVGIERFGSLTRGRTVADISGRHKNPANVDVGIQINRERFLEILFEGLCA